MIRAFIAVEIAPATIKRITAVIDQLEPRLSGIRWASPDNIHLTLKFLGDIDESKIDPIGAALAETLRPFPRLTINAKGLGVFPNPKRARVLWIGLFGSELNSLKRKLESALTPLGIAAEERIFTPHLTIGRWRQGERPDRGLEQELGKWRDYEFGPSSIDEVILFQSDLKPGGAIYHRLKVATLKPDPVP